MFVAPIAVASWASFVEFGVLIAEHEPYVDAWVLFPNEQVFLSVIDSPTALAFDIKIAALFRQLEVRGISALSFRPCVTDFVWLVFDLQTRIFYLARQLVF